MEKIWLAVDKDGTENISDAHMIRFMLDGAWYTEMDDDNGNLVVLPRGTIEKLIGRKLTWEDQAVSIIVEEERR